MGSISPRSYPSNNALACTDSLKVLLLTESSTGSNTAIGSLRAYGFETATHPYEFAAENLRGTQPDVVLVDIAAAFWAQRDCLIRIRAESTATVIALLAAAQSETYLQYIGGLIDDFVIKPYHSLELSLRVKKAMRLFAQGDEHGAYPMVERRCRDRRRYNPELNTPMPIFRIDSLSQQILFKERDLKLTPREFQLLSLLLSIPGKTFSDREILNSVWPHSRAATANDVHQYIHRVRRKLEPDIHQPRWIVSVPGFGYRIDGSG